MFSIRPVRFAPGPRNLFLVVALSINAWTVPRLIFRARGWPEEITHVWISHTFELLMLSTICTALAVGCFFALSYEKEYETKWGGRIIATGLPIAGVGIALWAHFAP